MTKRETYRLTSESVPSDIIPQFSKEFTYGKNGWSDVLTGITTGNVTTDIATDNLGNITDDGVWEYRWKNGKQLATMENDSEKWDFFYDASGMRTARTDGSVTYTYTYEGSTLVKMTYASYALIFTYGINGHPMSVNFNGTDYYYMTNALGDVIGILDSNGNEVVTYAYDAWGNPLPTGGTMADTLGYLNPLRYRSYVYDEDTKLYYLQSRYYNPEICRFISADSISYLGADGTPVSYNLFAYCGNNPVNYYDPSGHFVLSTFLICLSVGAAIGGALGGYTAYVSGGDVSTGILTGALLGAAVGAIIGIGGAALSGAVSSSLGKTTTDLMSVVFYGGEFGTWEDYAIAFAFGGLGGSLGGITGKLSGLAKGAKLASDVMVRPLANQLTKSGTRGKSFNTEKYWYDVITRAATYGGSHSIMQGNMFGISLKIDLGKCFYRATLRSLYGYV